MLFTTDTLEKKKKLLKREQDMYLFSVYYGY